MILDSQHRYHKFIHTYHHKFIHESEKITHIHSQINNIYNLEQIIKKISRTLEQINNIHNIAAAAWPPASHPTASPPARSG